MSETDVIADVAVVDAPPAVDWEAMAKRLELEVLQLRATNGVSEESLGLIAEAEARVDEAEKEVEAAKKQLSYKKSLYDEAVEGLRAIIKESKHGYPLFPVKKPAEFAGPPDPASCAEPAKPAEDDSWMSVPLADLKLEDGSKLSPSILTALEENVPPLLTVGDVAKWSQRKALTEIPKIGEGKAKKIDLAMDWFWEEQRKLGRLKPSEPAAEPEAAQVEKAAEAEPDVEEAQAVEKSAEQTAWRLISIHEMGFAPDVSKTLETAGFLNAQDLAFAVFTDVIAKAPGIESPELAEEISASLEAFRQTLPDAQAFDFAEFAAEHMPPAPKEEATELPAKPKRNRKAQSEA